MLWEPGKSWGGLEIPTALPRVIHTQLVVYDDVGKHWLLCFSLTASSSRQSFIGCNKARTKAVRVPLGAGNQEGPMEHEGEAKELPVEAAVVPPASVTRSVEQDISRVQP